MQFSRRLSREVRQHALAAVVLEEWLQELAAIAQEQSVLQKEQAAYQVNSTLQTSSNRVTTRQSLMRRLVQGRVLSRVEAELLSRCFELE